MEDIPAITYEGGGANWLDQASVSCCSWSHERAKEIKNGPRKTAPATISNAIASGSKWLRAGEGGLLDLFVDSGSIMKEGDVVARISDPATPGLSVDILAPEDGLMICIATNPFVAAGMPVGHFLPISKHMSPSKSRSMVLDDSSLTDLWMNQYGEKRKKLKSKFAVNGMGGSVDKVVGSKPLEEVNSEGDSEEEA